MSEHLVYPDAVRGIIALLRGVDLLGHRLHPVVVVPEDVFTNSERTVVHVQRNSIDEGAVDRVEEVRITVYADTPLGSQDVTEAIVSLITGDGVQAPATDESAAFYFDHIRQRVGPAPISYPSDSVFPSSTVVAARARPMTLSA